MQEMIKAIREAEQQAAALKEDAYSRAARIVAAAEETALKMQRECEADCRSFLDTQIKAAERAAQVNYNGTITVRQGEAVKYAEEILKNADEYAAKIAGRVSGDR